mmetsp:Transcript_10606/g.9174  ORF Transcript_10606/g.9174 Transcript_10606/m.9174 type:complete len:91 (+) Transcript_10606:19-291(+)
MASKVYPTDLKKQDIDENETKATLRQNIEKVLNGNYGKLIEKFSTFLSFFSIVVYVIRTYVDDEVKWFNYVDIGIMVFYLIQYALELFAS